ncbi:type VI secretion system ATPase TssH [Massilia sp. CF038]|uniref:type VI secretion system ATPase TssH n=1 Tax=Massilia sp. CF038 TaxID=1881045 RepID=UPI000918C174|nr:type VI secretion system ATPase TssH [Massilia sp. CF038]SHH10060.1 type VI secretion system protein VasG [Massilia sp. CF038]
MIALRTLIGRLDGPARLAFEQAADACQQRRHAAVQVEHVLERMLAADACPLKAILMRLNVGHAAALGQLRLAIDGMGAGAPCIPAMAPAILPWLQNAWLIASLEHNEAQVTPPILLAALLREGDQCAALLRAAPALAAIDRARLGELCNSGAGTSPLERFTVDLTAQARARGYDPISGREAEVRQIIDILMRRRQNNPMLVGEPGVGKTAVVEGFAARVAAGDVPPALAGVAVLALDLGLLQAGAGMRGEFESRLKQVIGEVAAARGAVILFIDEAHQLIGAGGAEGQGDAANLLKPALARGELRTIAATTWSEYKQYVDRDAALARRFQVIRVDEPDEEAAVTMLRGVVATLERHHGVTVLDAAVRDAVRLSQRYISERKLPDKAINVLDTACARVGLGQTGAPAELETLRHTIGACELELRALGREALAGTDYAARIDELRARLAHSRAREAELGPRLTLERSAVQAVLDKRAQLQLAADDGDHDEDDAPDSVARLSIELERLETGLAVIQNEQPMVPLCVDSAAVAAVVGAWTGVPVGKMLSDELHTMLHLKDRLAERVVGQDSALDTIARRLRTFHAELDDPHKPVGVFLLVGPSGVGKSETAGALADLLYGGERNMIVVNMSEFQEAHSVARLQGAPPGYVGYGRGGVLTEAVRRRPYCVLLLDEVEKAHADVMELFYKVFDKGSMEDGQGLAVDFRNAVILMTSNLGHAQPGEGAAGDALQAALQAHFAPALLARMVVVPYAALGAVQIARIVALKLERIRLRFERSHGARLHYDTSLAPLIGQRCGAALGGARHIDQILTQTLLPELAERVLERLACQRPFASVRVGAGDGVAFDYSFDSEVTA